MIRIVVALTFHNRVLPIVVLAIIQKPERVLDHNSDLLSASLAHTVSLIPVPLAFSMDNLVNKGRTPMQGSNIA
jgi:hypothetical protein